MQNILLYVLMDSENSKEHFVYIKDFNKHMGSSRTYYCKHCVQPFIRCEEKLKCHMNRGCYNVVETIRVLPKQNENWVQYEDDKMMYKEKLCPFVCRADFECFWSKEHRNEDGYDDDNNNASNTASSSNETPPHLGNNKTQTTRKVESNHEPNSYAINIEVREDYIDIVNKNNLQLFYLHRDENEDAVESFIHQMIHIEEHILNICKKSMSKGEYSKFKLPIFSIILRIMMVI